MQKYNIVTTTYSLVKVEGEDWLVHLSLRHQRIEHGRNAHHWDSGESHAKDTIELTSDEGQARLFSGLSESLIPSHHAAQSYVVTEEITETLLMCFFFFFFTHIASLHKCV